MAADANRLAAALDYLERIKRQAVDFGGGVASNLAERAKSAGGLAFEALTSDPNIGRMTTAEFSKAAADRQTPRLDQAAQDLGTIGRAIVTQPIQTGKAIVQGEIERAQGAMQSPRAAGEYAGSFIDPARMAAALRKTGPVMAELDVYHGTPHRFPATEANPLGEFDASKIGTGEGAQAYGHGVYLAESPGVAESYKKVLTDKKSADLWTDELRQQLPQSLTKKEFERFSDLNVKLSKNGNLSPQEMEEWRNFKNLQQEYNDAVGRLQPRGSLYKADLPDEMIDRMLDWDKPFAKQPETVKKALRDSGLHKEYRANISNFASPMGTRNPNMRGQNFAAYLEHKLGGQQQASEYLRSLGIPGIRYLDAGSRGQGGSGTRNFVVFPGEEKKVRILERDGQKAPPQKIAQALEAAPTETPSSLVMPFTERKTAAGRAALKNLHKEQGVTYKDWSFERGGAHTPAGPNSGSPAFDVTMNGTYPDDFYGVNGLRYYGTGYDALDAETYMSLQKLAGRPNHPITVYRAVEKDAKGKINPGDWVTTSRAYAKEHGQSALGGNFKIVKSTVYAKDIWTSGDSMLEWGYHPQGKVPEIKWR